MRIMLVCAGGMSTGILVKKMEKYAAENNIDLSIKAYGIGNYDQHVKDYDVLLIGPQISHKEAEIRGNVSIPVAKIDNLDYALGQAENILKQAEGLL